MLNNIGVSFISDTQHQSCETKKRKCRWNIQYSTDGDAIDSWYSTILWAEALIGSIWYSRNWRRDCYPILKELETRLILNKSTETWMILKELSGTQSIATAYAISPVGILLHKMQAKALVGSTRYSTNWRRDQYLILNKSFQTQLIFNTAWQSANALAMIKLIHNLNIVNNVALCTTLTTWNS